MPEISVIVPVYKVEKYLARCIDSILTQTFTDFELLLIDDGSPDNCGKICDEYALKDHRIKVIHQENGGVGNARNIGLEKSTGKYITFVDSDDFISPECLGILFSLLYQFNVSCSACGYQICTDNEWHKKGNNISKVVVPEDLFLEKRALAVVPWAKLFEKKLFNNIVFPKVRAFEDTATIFKVLFSVDSIAVTDFIGYAYFQNSNSITNGAWTADRLYSITAAREQIGFFKKKGFNKAFKSNIISLYNIEIREYKNASKYGTRKEKRFVRKCLKNDLKQYKSSNVLTYKERLFYLLRVYPIGTIIIKIHALIKSKLGK